MKLHQIKVPLGSKKKKKRVGRGHGSGHGKTSCRGQKGQLSRSQGKGPRHEGGQTPLIRRVPKLKGFTNINKIKYAILNLGQLQEKFPPNSIVEPKILQEIGWLKGKNKKIKILGDGELLHPLIIKAHAFSKSATEKIEKAGGTFEVIT